MIRSSSILLAKSRFCLGTAASSSRALSESARIVASKPKNSSTEKSAVRSNVDEEQEIADIYNTVKKYTGGSIDLDLTEVRTRKVAKLYINQPRKRNAFSGAMFCQLLDAIRTLEDPKIAQNIGSLLIVGKSGSFCSGADLQYVQNNLQHPGGWLMSRIMQHSLTKFMALPFLTATLMEGFTVCGGSELAVWTDFRFADHTTKIIWIQCRRGLTTAWGGTTRLVQLLGSRRALQILLTGKTLTARSAQELGLVDFIVPKPERAEVSPNVAEKSKTDAPTDSERFVVDWLAEMCSHTEPHVIHAFKRIVNHAASINESALKDVLAHERQEFVNLWGTPFHLAKFNEQFKVKKC